MNVTFLLQTELFFTIRIDMEKENLISTKEAAFILKCSEVHARRILEYAESREELGNGKFRALYSRCRVLRIASERECAKCVLASKEKGLRSCRTCGEKFHKEDLISGKCNHCRAHDLCRNFLCHNDCFKCKPDCSLLKHLKHAIEEYEKRVS